MLSTLRAKKRKLEATDEQVELEVLLDFLRNTRAEKEEASYRRQRYTSTRRSAIEALIINTEFIFWDW